MSICLVDYGVGNIHSARKALELFSDSVVMSDDRKILENAKALVLPGVGSFEAGMTGLQERNLVETVRAFADSGRPILGICLGAQLLLSKGYEFGEFEGLNIIPGEVHKFPKLPEPHKTPHIGWNSIEPPSGVQWSDTILQGIQPGALMYFVHSYVMQPTDSGSILSLTEHGGHTFCSAVRKGNVYGCQFHPEKSHKQGLRIIENFAKAVVG